MRAYYSDVQFGHGSNNPFLPYWGGNVRSVTQDALRIEKGATSGRSVNIYLDLLCDTFVNACFSKQISEICTKGNLLKAGDDRPNSKLALADCEAMLAKLGRNSASNEGAQIFEQGLTLERLIEHLAIAKITGLSTAEIVWTKKAKLPDIARVVAVDPRTIIAWKDEYGNVYPKLLTRENSLDGIFLPANQFIMARHWSISGADPLGMGLGRQLYYPVTWKRSILTFWLAIADKASDPQLRITYPEGTQEQDKQKVLDTLLDFGRKAGIAVPSGWSVDVIERNLTGAGDFLQRLIEYCDDQIAMILLGTTTSGTETAGGVNRETINNSLRVQLAKQWSDDITSIIANTLLKWYTEVRYGNTAAPPTFYKNFIDETDVLEMAQKAKNLGYTLDISQIESSLNMKLLKRETPKAGLPGM